MSRKPYLVKDSLVRGCWMIIDKRRGIWRLVEKHTGNLVNWGRIRHGAWAGYSGLN